MSSFTLSLELPTYRLLLYAGPGRIQLETKLSGVSPHCVIRLRVALMQKVRRISTTDCFYRIYWFYFTSPTGFLFMPFLHSTCSLSVKKNERLRGWFPFEFFLFSRTQEELLSLKKWQGFYLLWQGFPLLFRLRAIIIIRPFLGFAHRYYQALGWFLSKAT